MRFLFLAFLFSSAAARVAPAAIVRFDQTTFSFLDDRGQLRLTVDGTVQRLADKPCARSVVEPLRRQWRAVFAPDPRDQALEPTPFDVEVVTDHRSRRFVRGSRLGTWLRSLPTRFLYAEAEARLRCQR